MSVDNVKAFFKRLEEDEAFRAEFAENETLEKGNRDTILKAAAESGYPFTMDDLKQAQEELKDVELTPEQLEKVSGGYGLGICFIVGYGSWTANLDGHTVSSDQPEMLYGVCLILGVN